MPFFFFKDADVLDLSCTFCLLKDVTLVRKKIPKWYNLPCLTANHLISTIIPGASIAEQWLNILGPEAGCVLQKGLFCPTSTLTWEAITKHPARFLWHQFIKMHRFGRERGGGRQKPLVILPNPISNMKPSQKQSTWFPTLFSHWKVLTLLLLFYPYWLATTS